MALAASVSLKAAHRGLQPLLVTAVCSASSLASFSATSESGAKQGRAARCSLRGALAARLRRSRYGYGHREREMDVDRDVGTDRDSVDTGMWIDVDADMEMNHTRMYRYR